MLTLFPRSLPAETPEDVRTQQLRLCLDALEKRDKQVADLSIECATKGKLATMEEAQRDEALKTAADNASGGIGGFVWAAIGFVAGGTIALIATHH